MEKNLSRQLDREILGQLATEQHANALAIIAGVKE
jgi:hypothetical protein